jgi:hypothetical protein
MRGTDAGGILGYPLDWVYQEVAALSTRVNWTYEDVLNLDHAERRRWLEEITKLEREASHDTRRFAGR